MKRTNFNLGSMVSEKKRFLDYLYLYPLLPGVEEESKEK